MLDADDYQWAKNVLKKLEFFSQCSDDDILALVESLEKQHYRKDSTILFQGEISNRFFLVREGTVGIWKTVLGEKKRVAELGPERTFGEISLLTPTGATATVKASTDADILSLSYENLESAFRKNPESLKAIQTKLEQARATTE